MDADTLRSLSPQEVASYLQAKGWILDSTVAGMVETFSRETHGRQRRVILPLSREFADYALRLSELLDVVQDEEQRSQLSIVSDVVNALKDVVRVTWSGPETRDGTVPLDLGANIVERAKDLLRAGACAAVERKASYASRPPSQVTEYLAQARYGQTESGSYTVTLLSPLSPSLTGAEAGKLFESQVSEPFGRAVTLTLAEALGEVEHAAERSLESSTLEAFRAAVPKGVSADLCSAVAGLGSYEGASAALRIGFTWAPSRPVSPGTPTALVIKPDHMPVISRAARALRQKAPRGSYTMRGHIVRLTRGETDNLGEVTIAGFVDDAPRKVHVALEGPEYSLATAAHDQRELVVCSGRLEQAGNAYWLRDAMGFDVVPDEDGGFDGPTLE